MWASLAVAVGFLLTIPTAESCSCWAMHLQTDFCESNVVIKGKFLSITDPEELSKDEWSTYYTYRVDVLKVFKGGPDIKDLNFKSHIFVCPLSVQPSTSTDYLITGSLSDGEVLLDFCNHIVPWSELSVLQIKGIQGEYSKGCSCVITIPETDSTQSSWCLYSENEPQGPNQDKNQRCVPISNDTCIWENIPD